MVFIKMADVILDPEYLDQMYREWLLKHNPDHRASPWFRSRKYQHKHRGSNQAFEDWLFAHGFTVVQREKQRYLKFSGDEKRLTWFLLKYGVTA